MIRRFDRAPWRWLVLAVAMLVVTQVRAPLAILGWLAPIPWLRYLRVTSGWRARLAFAFTLFAAWTLATAKIASEPKFLFLAPLFALPIAVAQLAAFFVWNELRTPATFALASAIGEWALYTLTPFGSWGATAYTQLDDLPFLQSVAVVGLAGAGAIVSFVAASIESAITRDRSRTRTLVVAAALVVLVHVAGALRLARADVAARDAVVVAAIATDSDVAGLPLPSRDRTRAWDRALLSRSADAAHAGAVLAVWPEAATLVWPDEEADWIASVRSAAREDRIDIVAAYVVPTSTEPFAYRNELRVFRSDGVVASAYGKRHPVPGEPAVAGVEPAPAVARDWGLLSGAICYDYDFPAMGRERAERGVDIVAVPASDWRGIDPVHAQMAGVRAIESGHSVLRSTRFGLSLAVDPYGRVRGWHSSFERGLGVMLTELPRGHTRTLYAIWGDLPLAFATLIASASLVAKRLRRA